MEITRKALKHIQDLRDRQGVSRTTGLRLGLKEDGAFLRWDPSGPQGKDMVVVRRGFPVFIDTLAYVHLADYVLDYGRENGSSRFLLRPRPGTRKGKSGRKPRSGSQNISEEE